MIVRKCANRGTLPCRDEGNPVLSYMILNYIIVLNITRIIWKVNRLAKAIYADLALKIRYLIKIHEVSSRTVGKTLLEVQGVLMRWDLGAKI